MGSYCLDERGKLVFQEVYTTSVSTSNSLKLRELIKWDVLYVGMIQSHILFCVYDCCLCRPGFVVNKYF